MQFQRKMLPPVLMGSTLIAVLLTSSFASTMFMHRVVYAQDSNSSGFGNTTNLALPNGKSIPINYLINTGKLLDLTLDKSRATLRVLISSPSADNGNLTIQIPRDVVDDKKEGNADEKFTVHVDGKDGTFKETANTKTTRTLSIQFNKDAKVIDIIGSKSTVQ